MADKFEMGVYGTVYMVHRILTIIGVLGLQFVASRFIPFLLGKNERPKAIQTTKKILKITVLSALILFSLQFILSDSLSKLLLGGSNQSYLFKIASFATLFAIFYFILAGFLQGLHKFRNLAFFSLTSQTIRVILSIMLLLFGIGVAAVFIGYVLFNAIFSLFALSVLFNFLKNKNTSNNNDVSIPLKNLMKFSIPMMIFQLVIYLSDSIDRFIVLNLLGVISLGVYTVVLSGASTIIMIFCTPLQTTLIPGMSEIYAKTGSNKISRSIRISSRYISIIFIPAAIGFAVLSPLALLILAGSKYLEATLPLSIISVGLAMHGFSTTLISALTVLKETSRVSLAIVLSLISEIGLTFILVPYLGIIGAAISRIIMFTLMLGLLFLFSYKLITISFDKTSILKASISSIFMGSVLLPLTYYTNYRLILTPLYIVTGLIVYATVLTLIGGLSRYDIKFIVRIFPGGEKLLCAFISFIIRIPILQKILKRFLESDRLNHSV